MFERRRGSASRGLQLRSGRRGRLFLAALYLAELPAVWLTELPCIALLYMARSASEVLQLFVEARAVVR